MPNVIITNDAAAAIRAAAQGSFHNDGHRLQNGSWVIPLGEDTLEALQGVQFPGETLSDTIIRICFTFGKPRQ